MHAEAKSLGGASKGDGSSKEEVQMTGERLATLDPETGKRPGSRIGNAGNARQLVNRLKYEDETRMYRHTRIQGLLDGNPPWAQKRLTDLGQGHRANFNLREGEGIVDSAKTPYYDLVFEVPYFAQITFDIPGVEPFRLQEWNNIISDEYFEVLSAWAGFDQNIQLHQWQMIVNGVGPIFWPHALSWYSEATKSRKVLVPQETKANVDQLETVAVLHSWRADELEGYISGANGEEHNGWNVPLCKKAIIDCANREMQQTWGIENYDLYQRAIRTGDLFYGIHRSSRIYVASLFIREFGGRVSHYILTDQVLGHEAETYQDPEKETGYLYIRKNKFENFSQVICPFFFDTGPDGTWHSVKGLGPKIYDFCDVSNRTFCQMLDGSVIGSGITLEAQDGASLEETQVALVGGVTVVQPGYKVVQTRIAEALNGAMTMRRELQNVLQSNTGSYRQRPSEESKEPTLGQAQMNFQQQALLSKGATNRYYNNMDRFHTENVRRLLDPSQNENIPGGREAQMFVVRCLMRGIPQQVMKFGFIRKVRAVRSLGYGSPQLRDMATKELITLLPLMQEPGRNHALRARAAALPGIGQSQVDSFFPKIEEQQMPNVHASMAMLENNALRNKDSRTLVEPGQNHSIHFDVHAGDLGAHLKQPDANPIELLTHLTNAGPHMAQHLQMIANDPTRKQEIAQKQMQLQQFGKVKDKLQQNVEEAMRAQMARGGNGQQQAPDPNLLKVQGELALKKQKQDVELGLKAHGAAFKEAIKDKSTAADITRKNLEAAATHGRAHAQTAAEIARANMEAAHGIHREHVQAAHDIAREHATAAAGNVRENIAAMGDALRQDMLAKAEAENMQQQQPAPEEGE